MASVTAVSKGRVLTGLLAFLITPFAITGIFRLSEAVPTTVPFLLAAAVVVGVWRYRPRLRSVALGVASGAALHAAFLAWLFDSSDLSRM